MIVKKKEKGKTVFCVYDSTGKKLLGKHKTRAAALKQLAAIEISKKRRKGNGTKTKDVAKKGKGDQTSYG